MMLSFLYGHPLRGSSRHRCPNEVASQIIYVVPLKVDVRELFAVLSELKQSVETVEHVILRQQFVQNLANSPHIRSVWIFSAHFTAWGKQILSFWCCVCPSSSSVGGVRLAIFYALADAKVADLDPPILRWLAIYKNVLVITRLGLSNFILSM